MNLEKLERPTFESGDFGFTATTRTASVPHTGLGVSSVIKMLAAPALVAFGFTGTAIVTGGCLGNAAPPKPPTAQVIRAARESNDSKGGDESREFAPMTQATAERDSLTHQKAVALVNAVLKVFSGASIKMEVRTDPDEGWSRTVLFVRTGIHDFDLRMDAEDQFYALVDLDENLRDALHSTVISFS